MNHQTNYHGAAVFGQNQSGPMTGNGSCVLSPPAPDQEPFHHASETAYREAVALLRHLQIVKEKIYMTAGCMAPQPEEKLELPIFLNLPDKTSEVIREAHLMLSDIEWKIFGK